MAPSKKRLFHKNSRLKPFIPLLIFFGGVGIHLAGVYAEERTKQTDRPNILLILIDDMSWNGPSCYGNKLVDTPNIDRLASRGMKFTSAYVTPICSPTRTELLSGRHSARMHITKALPGFPQVNPWARHKGPILSRGIPFNARTLAEALKDQGYRTAHLGKWHVGMNYTVRDPKQMAKVRSEFGFDHTFHGFSSFHGDKSVTALTNEAIRFLGKDDEKPFFVYLAHQTVHTHCAAPGNVVKQYLTEKRKPSGKFPYEGINNATYLAMIKHLDNETGRLLKALEERKLDRNTLVVFLSDNGGATRVTTNDPLRRGKCTSYEGGIRVPMLVSWPGVIRAGSVCDQAVHASLDLYPTLLDAAGGQKKKGQALDGKNIMPLLKENGAVFREAMFWHVPHYIAQPGNHFRVTPHSAVRKGDFKLIEFFNDYFEYDEPARTAIRSAADDYAPYPIDCAKYVPKGKVELFNLRKDIGEKNDLSSEMPEKVAELKDLLARWRKSVGAQMPVKNPRFNPTFKQPRKK
jgi:uncharacterized sulfatase